MKSRWRYPEIRSCTPCAVPPVPHRRYGIQKYRASQGARYFYSFRPCRYFSNVWLTTELAVLENASPSVRQQAGSKERDTTPGQSHTLLCCQRMILREYGTQRVIPQGIEFQIIRHDGGQKAAVHLPVDDPVPDLIIVAVQNLHIHLGIVLLKIVDDLRHPQGRDAGKAAHPQFALYLVVDVERRLPQPVFLLTHGFLPLIHRNFGIKSS